MKPAERIGQWLAPVAKGMGLQKGGTIIEPRGTTGGSPTDIYSLIYGNGLFHDIHAILAYRLYLKSDVLGTAVHRIAHNLAGLTLGLTEDGQEFIAKAPVIDFLAQGSEGYSARRFFYEIATSYLLTNEAWVILRGRPGRPPVSRTWVYPFDVVEDMSADDGLPAAFRTMADRDRRTYRRVEEQGRIRWISDDQLNELVPILGAEAIDRPFRGQSQVAPLYYAVSQNVEGKRHNSSMLANGLRTTGVIQPPEGKQFDKATVERIRVAIQALRGSGTSGSTLVFPHRVENIDLAISNQEMDYVAMLSEAKESVFNYYNIPLPLVTNDASTFNNFATAQTAFFDGAVFPVFDDIADALASGLSPRFPELQGRHIIYNENTIRALKGRNIERMRKSRETQAMTTNEIREVGGYPEVEGGDDVLVPSTLIPIDDGAVGQIPIGLPQQIPEEDEPDDAEPAATEV